MKEEKIKQIAGRLIRVIGTKDLAYKYACDKVEYYWSSPVCFYWGKLNKANHEKIKLWANIRDYLIKIK